MRPHKPQPVVIEGQSLDQALLRTAGEEVTLEELAGALRLTNPEAATAVWQAVSAMEAAEEAEAARQEAAAAAAAAAATAEKRRQLVRKACAHVACCLLLAQFPTSGTDCCKKSPGRCVQLQHL